MPTFNKCSENPLRSIDSIDSLFFFENKRPTSPIALNVVLTCEL